MQNEFKTLVANLSFADSALFYRGIEKENIRINAAGAVSKMPHPKALGAAFSNPWITTDFAESLIEVVTPTVNSLDALQADLAAVTQFCMTNLQQTGELLWPASMPGLLSEQDIALADYGHSNSGQMKHLYRKGLALRYGKVMQMIAGIHYNVSLSEAFFAELQRVRGNPQGLAWQDYVSQCYMAMIRNFFRYGWLLPYLFGASSVAAASSVEKLGVLPFLQAQGSDFIGPKATSLRLSRLGYQNQGQELLNISYNSVNEYAQSLLAATETPYPPFSKLGVRDQSGFLQLNDALLQIENEYYSPIRPKQPVQRCQRPANALLYQGVQYVELRALDLNPFEPLGFEANQLAFLELFLLFCLLQDSPELSSAELQTAQLRLQLVAEFGRQPGLRLPAAQQGQTRPLYDWAQTLFDDLLVLAERLQKQTGVDYVTAVLENRQKISDVSKTPSSRLLAEFLDSGLDYSAYVLHLAEQQQAFWQQQPVDQARFAEFSKMAAASLVEFQQYEQSHAQEGRFEDYLQRYFRAC